jgi:hypothetical protein
VQPSIKKEGFSFFDGKRLVLKESWLSSIRNLKLKINGGVFVETLHCNVFQLKIVSLH